jgi:hypothetical protein
MKERILIENIIATRRRPPRPDYTLLRIADKERRRNGGKTL